MEFSHCFSGETHINWTPRYELNHISLSHFNGEWEMKKKTVYVHSSISDFLTILHRFSILTSFILAKAQPIVMYLPFIFFFSLSICPMEALSVTDNLLHMVGFIVQCRYRKKTRNWKKPYTLYTLFNIVECKIHELTNNIGSGCLIHSRTNTTTRLGVREKQIHFPAFRL